MLHFFKSTALYVTVSSVMDGCGPLEGEWKKQVSDPSNWFGSAVLVEVRLQNTSTGEGRELHSGVWAPECVCKPHMWKGLQIIRKADVPIIFFKCMMLIYTNIASSAMVGLQTVSQTDIMVHWSLFIQVSLPFFKSEKLLYYLVTCTVVFLGEESSERSIRLVRVVMAASRLGWTPQLLFREFK